MKKLFNNIIVLFDYYVFGGDLVTNFMSIQGAYLFIIIKQINTVFVLMNASLFGIAVILYSYCKHEN